MYSEVKFRVDEYIRGKAGSEITFLQMGQSISPMAVDPILQAGEECLLYLQYDDNGILHILGGPQGRFNILKADNRVINQLERFKYESVAEIPEITRPAWTKVSKEKTQFVNQVKMKQANILRVRREQ